MWKYDSPIGPLFIKRLADGRYGFIYDGTVWESSHSPEAEADNVYMHCTGCCDWDKLDGKIPNVPTSLGEWTPC